MSAAITGPRAALAAQTVRVTATLAATLMVGACGVPAADGPSPSPTPTVQLPLITEAPTAYNAADLAFMNNMIVHHRQALAISEGVPRRSSNPVLIGLARTLGMALQADVRTLTAFLLQGTESATVKADATGPGAPKGMLDASTVARLESLSGNDFDALWLRSMLVSCHGGIDMANAEIVRGQNPNAVTLAQQSVSTLQATIATINGVLSR